MNLLFIFVFVLFTNVRDTGAYSPDDVRNNATDEMYNNVLLNPMIQQLVEYVAGVRDKSYGYIPDDVALVNNILSVQQTMFRLASFYVMYEEGTHMSRFNGGLAIEFESQRCDEVYSSKFPREHPSTEPWRYYRDTSYYVLNCLLPKTKTPKPIELQQNEHRDKRAIQRLNPPICGDKFQFISGIGQLSFPQNRTLNYTTNIRCEWVIQVPPRFGVKVSVISIDIEHNKDCYADYLTFHDGEHSSDPQIGDKVCGTEIPPIIKSTGHYLTVVFNSDEDVIGSGFILDWTIGDALKPHPGFVLTSTIVIDQVGDLNIDKIRVQELPDGEILKYAFEESFQLQITKPSTCPLASEDQACYFETTPFIISKIIATGISPNLDAGEDAIEVVFDHVIQTDIYPALYESPKFCIMWDSSVKNTAYGSWTRRGGKIHATNRERTICRYSKHGIYAVAAAVPPPVVPPAFQFSMSWYSGLVFTIIWISCTLYTLSMSKMNIPDWLNLNQMVALLLFCGIVLSGMHLELDERPCNILSFLLYYFGLTVFVWHCLKAAQFTGTFDKFFRVERNIFAFHFILGWCCPFFIAGLAGGAALHPREKKQSCWIAMKGSSIWETLTPTYVLVLAIVYLYYKGLKRAKHQQDIYNFPKMRNRAIIDAVTLVLFILSWIFGLICIEKEEAFAPQFFFCLFLSLTTIVLCLTAKQKRRSFERAFDFEDRNASEDKYKNHQKFIEGQGGLDDELQYEQKLMQTFFKKWHDQGPPMELDLGLCITDLQGATVVKRIEAYEIKLLKDDSIWNNKYANEDNSNVDENMVYYDEDEKVEVNYSDDDDDGDVGDDDDDEGEDEENESDLNSADDEDDASDVEDD